MKWSEKNVQLANGSFISFLMIFNPYLAGLLLTTGACTIQKKDTLRAVQCTVVCLLFVARKSIANP